ncbi:hypothetical protein [Demequina rhizosphaerae]|uniref:hypothetical protein n=1 Tax=Demequina rhizosphaerae TaxID=1638985 RepID=UPI000782D4F1|nr:hypothetical protein [Demequina rhizosphaerae]
MRRVLARLRGRGRTEPFPVPVLLHIGIPKSATTALQNGLAGSREQLRDAGILYPDLDGRINHHQLAVQLLGRKHAAWNPTGESRELLDRLIEEASDPAISEVVLSSELLAEGDYRDARRVLSHLGRDVRVLITLRSIPQLLPSSWQQGASTGLQRPFEEWLRDVLAHPERLDLRPLLSLRGDDGHNLITRWSSLVGARNVTILIPDPTDRTSVFVEAETLLGIAPGTLPQFSSNSSLSFTQSELTRLTGEATKDRLASFARVQLIQLGMGNGMKKGSGERGMPAALPDWAVDASQRAARALAHAITKAGVTVIGDLGALEITGRTSSGTRYTEPESFPLSMVTDALAGVFDRGRQEPFDINESGRPLAKPAKTPVADDAPTGSAVVATLAASGGAGLAEAIEDVAKRLARAGVSLDGAEPSDGATVELVDLRASADEAPAKGAAVAGAVVALEPAAVTLRRLYQGHLVAGGADAWEDFCASFDLDAVAGDPAWDAAADALRGLAARAGTLEVLRIDDADAVTRATSRVEALLGIAAGTVAGPADVDPASALLSPPQLALLRAFNERTWRPTRGSHYVRLIRNGMVSSLLGETDRSTATLALPAEVAAAAERVDARLARVLDEAGFDIPEGGEAGPEADPASIVDIPASDAVAGARGIILAARAAAKRRAELDAR